MLNKDVIKKLALDFCKLDKSEIRGEKKKTPKSRFSQKQEETFSSWWRDIKMIRRQWRMPKPETLGIMNQIMKGF
jgi:hypothetical protein